jgi:hypothetical protein
MLVFCIVGALVPVIDHFKGNRLCKRKFVQLSINIYETVFILTPVIHLH